MLVALHQREALLEARVQAWSSMYLRISRWPVIASTPSMIRWYVQIPSTNRSRSSGCALIRFADLAQAVVERLVPGRDHRLLELAHAPAQVVGDSAITSPPKRSKNAVCRASSTSCVARNSSTSPLGRSQQERRQVRGDPLLADVERAEAPGGVLLRLPRSGQPLLLVDREVELVRLPVLLLPQRVELAVAQELAAARRLPSDSCAGSP